jgi:hypothetical protein
MALKQTAEQQGSAAWENLGPFAVEKSPRRFSFPVGFAKLRVL